MAGRRNSEGLAILGEAEGYASNLLYNVMHLTFARDLIYNGYKTCYFDKYQKNTSEVPVFLFYIFKLR